MFFKTKRFLGSVGCTWNILASWNKWEIWWRCLIWLNLSAWCGLGVPWRKANNPQCVLWGWRACGGCHGNSGGRRTGWLWWWWVETSSLCTLCNYTVKPVKGRLVLAQFFFSLTILACSRVVLVSQFFSCNMVSCIWYQIPVIIVAFSFICCYWNLINFILSVHLRRWSWAWRDGTWWQRDGWKLRWWGWCTWIWGQPLHTLRISRLTQPLWKWRRKRV